MEQIEQSFDKCAIKNKISTPRDDTTTSATTSIKDSLCYGASNKESKKPSLPPPKRFIKNESMSNNLCMGDNQIITVNNHRSAKTTLNEQSSMKMIPSSQPDAGKLP